MSNEMTFVIMLFWRLFLRTIYLYAFYIVTNSINQWQLIWIYLFSIFLDGFSKVCSLNKNKIIKMQNKKKCSACLAFTLRYCTLTAEVNHCLTG